MALPKSFGLGKGWPVGPGQAVAAVYVALFGSVAGVALVAATLTNTPAAGSNALSGTITGSGAVSAAMTNGTAPVAAMRQVATSTYFPTALAAAGTTSMTRKSHYARDAITSVKLGYSTAYANTATMNEVPVPAAIPVNAWVEYPAGTYTPVPFGGSTSSTFAADSVNLSDATTIPGGIPNGAQFWTWTYAGAQAPVVPFITGGANVLTTSAGEGSTIATSGVPTTPSSTVPTGTAACGMAPQVVLGSTSTKSVVLIGNSRTYGQYSAVSSTSDRGYYATMMAPTTAYANFGVPSDSSDSVLGGSPTMRHRIYWSQFFTNVLDAMSYTDGTPVGGTRDHSRAIFSGKGYIGATVEGNTTSSNGWISPDDQVNTGSGTAIIGGNQNLRSSGVPYLDTADIAMTARDTGHFAFNGSTSYTNDGLHLNAAGNAYVVATATSFPAAILGASAAPFTWSPTLTASSPVFTAAAAGFGNKLSGGGFTAWGIGPTGGGFAVDLRAMQAVAGTATLVGGNGFSITVSGAGVVSAVIGNITLTGTGTNLADGAWHHIEVDSTATLSTLWFDGVMVASSSTARGVISSQTAARTFGIRGAGSTVLGTISNSANDPALDELAIWQGVRHTSAFTPPSAPYAGTEAGLITLMHLDDATVIVGPGAGIATAIATPTVLPATASAPSAAYSLTQLTSTATKGAAVCAMGDTNATPTTTVDVPFNSDGTPNFSAATTAFGTTFAVWKLYDQSGNGYDAVQATSTSRGVVNTSIDGKTWVNQGSGTVDNLNNYTIPSGLTTSRQNLTLVSVAGGNNSTSNVASAVNAGGVALLTAGSTDASASVQMATGDGGLATRTNTGAYSYFPMGADLTVLAARYNATNTKFFRNEDSTTAAAPTASTGMTGGLVGGALFSGYNHSDSTRHFAHVVYAGALSDGDVAAVKTSLYTMAGITAKTAHVLSDGDSIQRGVGATFGRNLWWYLRGQTTGNPYLEDVAIGGDTALTESTTHGSTWFAGMFRSGYTKNLYVSNAGTNDIYANNTAGYETTLEGYVTTLINNAKAAGFTVLWQTVIPRNNFSATQNTIRANFNSWLVANAASLGITVIDYRSMESNITYADSSSPGTVGSIGVHPDSNGYSLMAAVAAPVINAALVGANALTGAVAGLGTVTGTLTNTGSGGGNFFGSTSRKFGSTSAVFGVA